MQLFKKNGLLAFLRKTINLFNIIFCFFDQNYYYQKSFDNARISSKESIEFNTKYVYRKRIQYKIFYNKNFKFETHLKQGIKSIEAVEV